MSNGAKEQLFVRRNGETRGPVSLEQLRRGVEAGKVPLDSKVAVAGADEWEALPDFFARKGIRVDASLTRGPGYSPQGHPAQQPPPKKGLSTFAAVLLALIVFFVVIPLGSCVACAVCASVNKGMSDSKTGTGDSGTPVSTATASAVPEPTATLAPTTVTVSFATFTPKNTLLDECVDFIMTPPLGVDGGSELAENFAKAVAGKKGKSMSRIYKACTEQFRTTPALATCSTKIAVPLKNDAGTVAIDCEEGYYNLDTLTSGNEYMKDCLDTKGDWTGVDKDSDAYREAVHARARREIEQLQKRLGQQ